MKTGKRFVPWVVVDGEQVDGQELEKKICEKYAQPSRLPSCDRFGFKDKEPYLSMRTEEDRMQQVRWWPRIWIGSGCDRFKGLILHCHLYIVLFDLDVTDRAF